MSDLRDLIEEIEALIRDARGTLGRVMDPADPAAEAEADARPIAVASFVCAEEAKDDLDQALARIDRARVMGVIPR